MKEQAWLLHCKPETPCQGLNPQSDFSFIWGAFFTSPSSLKLTVSSCEGRQEAYINATDWLGKSLKILYSMLVKDIALRGCRAARKGCPGGF